ncbi:MAG: DUF4838 domain-containing protein [Candidatus Hydrogenedentes bacterium]|nr:DUF4838 domain-containing protein [Candidatus Hydrogenedentota bacterium]
MKACCLLVVCALAILALPQSAAFAAWPYTGEPTGNYMKEWLLCGPFSAGEPADKAPDLYHLSAFDADPLGGEAGVQPKEGEIISAGDVQRQWVRHVSETGPIDLDSALSDEERVFAYAYAPVECAAPQPAVLAIGSNDGVRVWLNGQEVLDYAGARSLEVNADLVPVFLQQGVNHLLLKVEERGNLWGFSARLLGMDNSLAEKLNLFEVRPNAQGVPRLVFVHRPELLGTFLTAASLRVTPFGQGDAAIWEGGLPTEAETVLPIPTENFGRFRLSGSVTLVGGKELPVDILFSAGVREDHVLFQDGQSEYTIVLRAAASSSEQWAAQELQHWLKEVGGVDLPVVSDAEPLPAKAILLGYTQHTAALAPDAQAPAAGDEAFAYWNVGPHLIILGGEERGAMYGVLSFLERELGCRWYTKTVSVAPRRSAYNFSFLHHREAPDLRVRNVFYYEAFDPTWAARNRSNGAMSYRDQPGGVECYWGVHTFYPFMPPEQYFDEHPEYYSLVNGKRTYDHAQLCLTNADVLNIVTERLRETMRANPEYLIYSVSQNDWRQPCECDNCQAIARAEGSESGPLLNFVNQVAERVQEEFPDKYVGTLAYQYTRKAPKTIRPRENVVIRLCSIECCFAHDFASCERNASFLQDLKDWAAISPHLYIWDYVVNFSHYIMPYPNFRALKPNIQMFDDNKAIGIMEQAAYQSRGGEFAELRAWVLAKLLWDKHADVDALVNDFMYGYYGRSGQFVRAYFDLLHNQITPETHIYLGLDPGANIYSDDFVAAADKIFDDAETVADSDEILQRVEMARLPLMYLKCKRYPRQSRMDGTYDRFSAIVAREGITHYAEAGQPHKEAFHAEMDGAL